MVDQSPAYDFSVTTSKKLFFLSRFRTVLSVIHMQVTDRPSPDAPSLTQAIIVQMVYWRIYHQQPCTCNGAALFTMDTNTLSKPASRANLLLVTPSTWRRRGRAKLLERSYEKSKKSVQCSTCNHWTCHTTAARLHLLQCTWSIALVTVSVLATLYWMCNPITTTKNINNYWQLFSRATRRIVSAISKSNTFLSMLTFVRHGERKA